MVHDAGEVFDAVLQVLQGFEFLHRHLIAHRDVAADNILINFSDSRLTPPPERGKLPMPFRGRTRCILCSCYQCLPMRCFLVFPVRYYIIDFEYSVRFPEDSTPERHAVTGLSDIKDGSDHPDDYVHDLFPEMLLPEPHCPFKSDAYQLGEIFLSHFCLLETEYPDLIKVFQSMTAVNPSCRPTVAEALKSIQEYHDGAQFKGPVPKPAIDPIPIEVRFQKIREANA
ncbi:hypothetical protein PILCRDRAFT_491185 [Piloderma croceum F 1598]|uniref:Protein kinase domain-containing protein n=1 Tax=Piloderma croceum (strain F 1598) TaxID=765440 RepID=A0A0C3FQ16_PILCF|nr:hypothetical protein PILCRDRAFT_491185 [Piloderma croceum F 1598]